MNERSAITKAIEKADEACPFMQRGLTINGKPACQCKVTSFLVTPEIKQGWPGHAAIRELAGLVREYGHVLRCYCHVCGMQPGAICGFAGMAEHLDPYRDPRCLREEAT